MTEDDEIEINFNELKKKVKKLFSSKKKKNTKKSNKTKEEKNEDDDEIEIDFSKVKEKIKGLFSSKKKSKTKTKKSEDKEGDEEIDFTEIIRFLKENKKTIFYVGLISIILLGGWIRTLSISNYKDRLLGLDPYAFYRYAQILLENGSLPEIDTMRYFPTGFKTFREHQTSTYFMVGTYLTLSPILGGELIDYVTIYPVIAFMLSMAFFYLMVKEVFNKKTALIATAFLAFAPSYLFRTIAGFSDKESMAMVFWFSMIYFLVRSIKSSNTKKVLINGSVSGLLAGFAGLTWGGTNFLFFSISMTFILLALIDKLSNKNILTYLTWYGPMILMNATMTLRYGGLSLIENEMFLLPTIALLIIGLKVLVYELYINKIKKRKMPKSFYFGIILIITTIIIIPLVQLTGIFDITGKTDKIIQRIIHPMGSTPFALSVTENQAPYFYDPQRSVDWWQRLKWFIPLFMTGALLLVHEMLSKFKKRSAIIIGGFAIFMTFFMFSKFINQQQFQAVNLFFSNTYLYTLPLLGIVIGLFYITYPKKSLWKDFVPEKLLLLSWFFFSIIGTRGAIRIVFASTPIFILIAAYTITRSSDLIDKRVKDKVYSSVPYLIALLIIFWGVSNTIVGAANYWPSFTNDWNNTMNWIKANTSSDAVFTHWWDYGYWVQTMGERTTTVDGGNYRIDWDEIIGGQMFSGYNITEVYESLEYFKNNETNQRPNYLLVMDDDILKYVQMANIGGRPGHYSTFTYSQRIENLNYKPEIYDSLLVFNQATSPGIISEDLVISNTLFPKDQSYVVNILIPMTEDQEFGLPLAVLYNIYTQENVIVPYDCVCYTETGCSKTGEEITIPSCISFIKGGLVHIPSELQERFMTQLYLLNKTIPGFNLVYSTGSQLDMQGILSQNDPTNIQIYEIDYEEIEKWVDNGSPAW